MSKKIKLLTAVGSIGAVGGLIASSCAVAKVIDSGKTARDLEVAGPDVIEMKHGEGGSAGFKAKDMRGMDVTNKANWVTSFYDTETIYFDEDTGILHWTPEFTKKWATSSSMLVTAEYVERDKGYRGSKEVQIKWASDDIKINYNGARSWKIDELAPYTIIDTTAIKVIKDSRVLDRSEYRLSIINITTYCEDVSLELQPDQSIKVGACKNNYDKEEGIGFGILVELVSDPSVFTSINGLDIKVTPCDIDVLCSESFQRIDPAISVAGTSESDFTLSKNNVDIANDPNVKDIKIMGSQGSADPFEYPHIWYDKSTRKIAWDDQFDIINDARQMYIDFTYTNPVTGQVHHPANSIIEIVPTYLLWDITGDEQHFNIDECVEFTSHTWSKNIYLSKSNSFPGPLDINKANITITNSEAPEGAITVEKEQYSDDKIKIIVKSNDQLVSGDGDYQFYISAQYSGTAGTRLYECHLKVIDRVIESSNYSEQLSGLENCEGSDQKNWKVEYKAPDSNDSVDVTTQCTYKLVSEAGTIPENSIWVDKSDNKAVTKWNNQLDYGNYKFHFDITYEYKGKQYTTSSKSISLTIGLATLVIENAPVSISASEWVAGSDTTDIKAKLDWGSKSGKTPEDVTKDVVWSIDGSSAAKDCLSVITDDTGNAHINWNNLINKNTVSSDGFKIVANLTVGEKKYPAAVSDEISINTTEATLSISGGSEVMNGNTGASGQAESPWTCSLNHGSIDEGDTVSYSLENLPDEIEDSVHIDKNGLISWDAGIEPTASGHDDGYSFTVKAKLEKDIGERSYEASTTVKLYIQDQSQKLLEEMSWETLTSTLNSEGGLNRLKQLIWLDEEQSTVGLTKTLELNQNGDTVKYTARIIGENHDMVSDTEKAALTFEIQELTYIGSDFDKESNCWYNNETKEGSDLRTALLDWANNALPEIIRNNIKTVKKQCATGKDTNERKVVETEETVWLPSATELGATASDTKVWAVEGTTYDYYKTDAAARRMKNVIGQEAWKGIYWTRSPAIPEADLLSACIIYGNGIVGSMFIDDANQFVAPCFCL